MAERPRVAVARRPFLGVLASLPLLGGLGAEHAGAQAVFVHETDEAVTIGNELVEVTVRRDNGGIEQLRAVERDLALRGADDAGEATHWELSFYSEEYERPGAASYNAPAPTIESSASADRAELRVEWTDAEVTTEDGVVDRFAGRVVSRLAVEAEDPHVTWRFDVENEDDRAIRSATCPTINGIGSLEPGSDDELVSPELTGRRITNPVGAPDGVGGAGLSYPSGFGTMQFTAYTSDAGGFYTDARDAAGHAKELLWHGGGDRPLTYRMVHYAPRRPGENLSIPYPASVGSLDGDWHDAADRYRRWLLEEGWLSADDRGPPAWKRDLGATFKLLSYTRPDYPERRQTIPFDSVESRMEAAADFVGVPLAFQWNGWQRYGEPAGLDWYPPKEGMDAFESTIAALSEQDVTTLGIYTVVLALRRSDFWQADPDRVGRWLVRSRDGTAQAFGSPEDDPFDEFHLEFSRPGFQRTLRRRLRRFAAAGAREFQVDGLPWQWVPDCYAGAHDHAPGFGGNWFPTATRRALRDLRRAAREEQPGFVLGGEGISDFYLPYVQAADYRDVAAEHHAEIESAPNVEVIPLLQYALGDFLTVRAGTIFVGRDDPYQRLALGRALVWGCIPRALTPPEANRYTEGPNPTLAYLRRVARARSTYANRFVARGRLLRDPGLDAATGTTVTETVRPGRDAVEVRSPVVLGSAWRSARGETGLVLTNVDPDGERRRVELNLAALPTALPDGPWTVYLVRNGRYERLPDVTADAGGVALELEHTEVALLVVARDSADRRAALDALVEAQSTSGEGEHDRLEEAKRRFEADELDAATRLAEAVVATTPGGDQSTQRPDDGNGTTTGESPGFTALAGLAGLGAATAARMLGRNDDDS